MVQHIRPPRVSRRPTLPQTVTDRLPPGQFYTPRWPVLHQGEVPTYDLETWHLTVFGLVARPLTLDWPTIAAMPTIEVPGDLHCVTRWSSLDHHWRGIAPTAIVEATSVMKEARAVMLHGEGGYRANLSLDTFLAPDVVLATHHDGESLSPAHGAPLRVIVPFRYAWKSVKWLRGIEFLAADQPGFWEAFGYHNSADPWREERFES